MSEDAEPRWMAMSGVIHEAMGDEMCFKVEDVTDHVLCVDIAIRLADKGYRLVGNKEARDG